MKLIEKYSKIPNGFYKQIMWNLGGFIALIGLLSSLLVLFGLRESTVLLNDEETGGVLGFILELIVLPIYTFLLGGMFVTFIWVGNKFLKIINKLLN